MVRRVISTALLVILLVFVLPLAAHLVVWSLNDRPSSWSSADWGPSGVLPPARATPEAKVHVMSARTGGLKGAVAVHSWIVTKKAGAARYERYDVVGWGTPVRTNAYPPDGRWYSNEPVIDYTATGREAEALIPRIETAVREYRWRNRGDYAIWPGPNSNTFVATIVRQVDGFDARVPPTALGRDYPADGRWFVPPRGGRGLAADAGRLCRRRAGRHRGVRGELPGRGGGLRPGDLDAQAARLRRHPPDRPRRYGRRIAALRLIGGARERSTAP